MPRKTRKKSTTKSPAPLEEKPLRRVIRNSRGVVTTYCFIDLCRFYDVTPEYGHELIASFCALYGYKIHEVMRVHHFVWVEYKKDSLEEVVKTADLLGVNRAVADNAFFWGRF